ncbi:hypothetical protein QA802_13435 [Streptomyces sp. B21-105]|uniref:hypothetical protein n=1 Tax=Streptomyces sp. B21-105 TaxID=3039417 RepID=UPI002FF2BBC1
MPDMTPSKGAGPENREPADDRRSATRRDETPSPYEPPRPPEPPTHEPPTHKTALPGETSRAPRGEAKKATEATEDSGRTTTASATPLPATPGPTGTNRTAGSTGTAEPTGTTEPTGTAEPTGTTGSTSRTGVAGGTAAEAGEGAAGAGPHDGRSTSSLLPDEECDRIATRLRHAVVGFVDGPRDAVAEADEALEELAGHLTEAVDRRRRTLRGSWHPEGGGKEGGAKAGAGKERAPAAATTVDTEQLRLALRDYRELTERLLHL